MTRTISEQLDKVVDLALMIHRYQRLVDDAEDRHTIEQSPASRSRIVKAEKAARRAERKYADARTRLLARWGRS